MKTIIPILLILIVSGCQEEKIVTVRGLPHFIRGDADRNMEVEMGDAMRILEYLRVPGTPPPHCMDAADADDDGEVSMQDVMYILSWAYVPESPDPPAPFPGCGIDPTADELGCEEHPCMGDRFVVSKKTRSVR